MEVVNLAKKISSFEEHWESRTIGQFDGHDPMVVNVKGEFVWHKHADMDDFFLVLNGRLVIQIRSGDVSLGLGEMHVVPKGVQHCPRAEEQTYLLLIEPSEDARHRKTRAPLPTSLHLRPRSARVACFLSPRGVLHCEEGEQSLVDLFWALLLDPVPGTGQN